MTQRTTRPNKNAPKKKLKMSKTYTADYLATLQFNILERLQRHDELYRNNVFCTVEQQTQRNESTIRRLIHRKKGEDKASDLNILKAFATVFNVLIDDLTNPTIKA